MMEYRRCAICNKPFVAHRVNAKYCSSECRQYAKNEGASGYRQKQKVLKAAKARRKKKQSVTEIAVAARKAGMTYGQYVAMMECGMAVEQKGE